VFAKIFEQIFDSSIAEDYLVRLVFEDLLVLADSDGVIDMTLDAIARRTNVPREIVQAGINELSMPDPESRTPDEEGRRIARIDSHRSWGWRIVNYDKYRNIHNEEARRITFRESKRRQRERERNPPDLSKTCLGQDVDIVDGQQMSTQAEANAEAKNNIVVDFIPDGNPLDDLVKEGFGYFLGKTGKSPKQYRLSRDKLVMGRRGFEELVKCAKRHQHTDPHAAAKALFEAAVDRLASSEFHNGKNDQGRTYLDWHQLFTGKGYRSPNKLVEFWLDDSKWERGA
jgi:hypothetical protein